MPRRHPYFPCADVELWRRAVRRSEADKAQADDGKAIPTSLGCHKNAVVDTRVKVGEVVGLSGCGGLDLKVDRPTAFAIGDKKRLFGKSLPAPLITGMRTGGALRQPYLASDSEARDCNENLLAIEEARSGRHQDRRIMGLKCGNWFRRRRGDAGGFRCCPRGRSRDPRGRRLDSPAAGRRHNEEQAQSHGNCESSHIHEDFTTENLNPLTSLDDEAAPNPYRVPWMDPRTATGPSEGPINNFARPPTGRRTSYVVRRHHIGHRGRQAGRRQGVRLSW